ncbi:MFS transporter [Streptomyces iconiensis]|uniref:MFS transporter n=1 Tax=Streptomyces iconiensis TaxID=1384038 RepID=A0ABT6ZQT5_9ACTN|nr:MFS transporter [Streptomyces iconiensis]MDJ1131418.1 MFS transporter [Streptomyces iconiensis]
MHTLRAVRGFPVAVRVLLVNQLGVDVGFYLLVPFLATYLSQDLGLSATAVGVVLGLRNLSQQGLFVLGGSAADRFGPRGVIITGCGLRVVGFGLFALGTSLPVLAAASVLSGLAGALFYPAVRSYLAHESGERRAEAFALLNVFAMTGSLLGMLLGSVLLLLDFRACALVAAGVFAALSALQLWAMPDRRPVPGRRAVWREWREALGSRGFLLFALAMAGMTTLENQLYLLISDGARQVTGRAEAVSLLLATGAVSHMACQLRLTRALEHRGGAARWMTPGLLSMAVAFLPPLLVAGRTHPNGPQQAALWLLPLMAGTLLLYLGMMVLHPQVMELIPRFGGEHLTGTYFGLFYVVSGLTAAGGSSLIGWTMDLADASWPGLPWVCCAGIGLVSAGALTVLGRGSRLPLPGRAPRGSAAGRHPGRLPRQPAAPAEDAADRRRRG